MTKLKPNKKGYHELHLIEKKSSSRNVLVGQDVVDAIVSYQDEIAAADDAIMFPPGNLR